MEFADQSSDASPTSPIDVGIIVALREEFGFLLEGLDYEAREYAHENLVFYFFSTPQDPRSPNSGYRCVATFIGEMGPTSAAVATERLLHLFSPITIVNLGICGAMSDDVKVGDVVIGDIIDEYISAAKASDSVQNESVPLRLSGRPYTTTRDYLLKCEHIQWTKPERFKAWQSSCEKRLKELAKEHDAMKKMLDNKVLHNVPFFHKGHVASGPIVSGATSYKKFLLAFRDRKYVAVEMEAAGVMAAAADRTTRTLVLRGVCDPADEGKLTDDKSGCEGALRQLAMKNTVEFLWMIMELSLLYFGKETPVSDELGSSEIEGSADVSAGLGKPNYEIDFRYLPDAIQLHGWKIGVKDATTPAPKIEAMPDKHFTTALSVVGPFAARLDYSVPDGIEQFSYVEILLFECGQYAFYIKVRVTKEGKTRSVWLYIRPGTAKPGAHKKTNVEWRYEVEPRNGPGEWKVMNVDLGRAVKETFGTIGWEFEKLIGFRIRGTVRIARIGLYAQGQNMS